MSDVDQILAEAAAAASAPKKERKAKDASDKGETPKAAKKAKEPKQWPVWNEDGTQATNEDGSLKTSTERTKKPKAPRLDKDGNPIEPKSRNMILDSQTLHVTDKGVEAKFREGTKRHDNFAAIQDGMTAKDYFEKVEGGRAVVGTFLTWYVAEGYVEVGGDGAATE